MQRCGIIKKAAIPVSLPLIQQHRLLTITLNGFLKNEIMFHIDKNSFHGYFLAVQQ